MKRRNVEAMKIIIKSIYLAVLVFLLALGTGFSQTGESPETQVSVTASNSLAFIGDQINLKFLVKTTHTNVREIKVQTEKRDFEIVAQQPTQTSRQTDYMLFEKNITIAFFKVGEFEIGPFTVELIKDGKIAASKQTTSIPITVKSVLKEEDKDIKGLKGLIDIRGRPGYLLKYVGFALLLLALIIAVILWIKQRKKARLAQPKPLMTPLEELEFQLKQLAGKSLCPQGKFKPHFIELTQILKQFLNRYYRFNAEDLTTEETLYHLKNCENERIIQDNLRFVFNTADLVKFAKFIPDPPVLKEIDEKIKEKLTRYKMRLTVPQDRQP